MRGGARSRRHYLWAASSVLLVICGVVAALLGAEVTERRDAASARKDFERSAEDVASILELAVQHDVDMAVDAGAFLADPDVTQTEFLAWAGAARLLERYPELVSVGSVVVVDDADLPVFAALAEADPAGLLGEDGSFAVQPPGDRPFYCLADAGLTRPEMLAPVPAGLDYCAEPAVATMLLTARDSGVGSYQPFPGQGRAWLTIVTPIYRGGGTPDTLDERRATFAGWTGTQLDPRTLLARALESKPGFSVSTTYGTGATAVTFTSGKPPTGAGSETIDLGNGWTVQVHGAVGTSGTTLKARLFLILRILVSVLLGLLVFALGTGRERARRQLVQRTSELHHQALHDALTGLPNRALLMDRVEQMLARDRRHHTSGAVLFLDLDDFKNVNDTLGHGAGDRLLVAVADRLAGTLRGAGSISRMGGDEFVVLVDDISAEIAPELVAQRLLDVMREPFDLDDASMPITASISIGIATGDRASAEELLRDADVALYRAKAGGKNRYELFNPEMQIAAVRRTDLGFELRSALADEQYALVYQPIYELETLTIVGVEALLRWNHPTRGPIDPSEFIPILEHTGQIQEVGRWVLLEACRQMATWHARGDTLSVSVNVSARQLDGDGVTEDIKVALRESGLAASALIIEVTETALMENVEATAGRLRAIKELGVRIAVDDFGTGYSSLAYLQQFPVDCLKIDRAFISAVTTSPESRALVSILVQLGKDLGLITLAEGVETVDEMDILRDADVNQAQGFLMARPQDPETLETQLLEPDRSAPSDPAQRTLDGATPH